jgi:hypothetical protein
MMLATAMAPDQLSSDITTFWAAAALVEINKINDKTRDSAVGDPASFFTLLLLDSVWDALKAHWKVEVSPHLAWVARRVIATTTESRWQL